MSLLDKVRRVFPGSRGRVVDKAEHVRKSWESLARHDPLWAIVSAPDKRGNRWDADEFFATGVVEVQYVLDVLSDIKAVPRRGRALDFGAGVGRLTQALARQFERVDGIDISPTMVAQARAYNRHPDRVRYLLGKPDRLPLDDAAYDFVLSKIVLQHMPMAMQRIYVGEFLRVLVPGGYVIFQAVSKARDTEGGVFSTPVQTPDGIATIDMNVFPRDLVEQTVQQAGGRILHAIGDPSAGNDYESLLYVATR